MTSLDRLRSRQVWVPVAGYGLLVLGVAWLYGLLTGTLGFGTVTLWEGWARCIESGPLPCENVGHPIGVDANVASAVIYGTWGLERLGVETATALNLLGIGAIAAGSAALWYLGRRFGGSHAAGALAAALYFVTPLVLGHAGLFQLFLGFAILPAPLALVVALSGAGRDGRIPPRTLLLGAVLLATGLLLVYLDPYPWVVATVLAAATAVALGASAAHRRRWLEVAVAAGLLVVLAVPGLVFRSLEAGSELETEMPADFYRGMGVDVGVALLPTTASTLGELTSLGHDPWRSREFTGDGSQLGSSYLGVPLLAAAALGLFWALRRSRSAPLDRTVVVGMGLGAAACLVLSLGPSLKVLDRDPTPRGDTIAFGDYLMPPEDATVEWPWASLYAHQPLASMRATYRWQSGGRVVLSVLAALGVAAALRRRPAAALAVGALVLLDTTPHALWDRRERAEAQAAELDRFEADMADEFGGGRLAPGERALFLPAENDYLIQYIAPTFDVRAYNLSFDKAITQIRPLQPPAVVAAMEQTSQGTFTPDALCALFRDDLVDVVVFDHFSLRWDSYRWPPAAAAVDAAEADLRSSGLLDTPGLLADEGRLSVVVRATEGGACAPSPP